jgi:hypothetical protein
VKHGIGPRTKRNHWWANLGFLTSDDHFSRSPIKRYQNVSGAAASIHALLGSAVGPLKSDEELGNLLIRRHFQVTF